jgi:hypothetical protein
MRNWFTSANSLAKRDPVRAALMGAEPFRRNGQSNFGQDYGGFGFDDKMGTQPAYGRDFSNYPAFGAAPPSPEAAVGAWQNQNATRMDTAARLRILRPNDDSEIKIERYAFTMSTPITLGTAAPTLQISDRPTSHMRPQRVTMSAPVMFFATVSRLQVANVVVTVGSGNEDAFNYNPVGQGMALDMSTLSPSNPAVFNGAYSGLVPPGYVGGTAVDFCVTFRGPSTIVA